MGGGTSGARRAGARRAVLRTLDRSHRDRTSLDGAGDGGARHRGQPAAAAAVDAAAARAASRHSPLHFAWQSIAAGWDVARRAFDPALPIRPGFVSYPARFRPGTARNVFTLVTSLVPGTVPVGDDGESITYHCLDVGQPVAAQLAAEEAILSRMLDEANAP